MKYRPFFWLVARPSDLIKEYVCKPLDMKDAGIHLEGGEYKLATGYSRYRIKLDKSIAPALESAVGLRSTMDDMIKFSSQ